MKIIGADERLAERRGVKALIVGLTGVGKTSLLRTLDPARVLFFDVEAGDLAVQDVPVDTIRVDDWPMARAEEIIGLGGETCAKSSATPITADCAPRRSFHRTLGRILRNAGFKGNDDGPRTV
jgi:hypothetical protein